MPRHPRSPWLLAPLALLLGGLCGCVSFPVNNAYLMGGPRFYDKTTYEPVDKQATFGVGYDTYKLNNGIGAEMGLLWSTDSGGTELPNLGDADVSAQNFEAFLGLRKTFLIRDEPFYPYVGMGFSYLRSELDVSTLDGTVADADYSFGIYIHGGIYWNFIGNATVGLDVRRLFASSVELLGVDTDADYTQALITLGFSF